MDETNSELWIIGKRCPNPNHNRINQCTQLVKVGQAFWTIDVFRLTGNRCNPAIHGLANLTYNNHAICPRGPQGLKNGLKWRRWECLTSKKITQKLLPERVR
jgi:hypothetical protein